MKITSIKVCARKLTRNTRTGNPDFRSYDKKPRVYVSPDKETVLENLFNRHSRPTTEYKNTVQDRVFDAMGLDKKDHTLSWSQYAGCSCPCSPGFIIKSKVRGKVLPRADVYVTLTNDSTDTVSVERNDMSPEEIMVSKMAADGVL